MPAATAVVVQDRPAETTASGTFVLDPGLIAAGGREVETIAIQGVRVGDNVHVAPRIAMSLIIAYTRVTGNDAVELVLENNTAVGIDMVSATWDFVVVRGTNGPLRG